MDRRRDLVDRRRQNREGVVFADPEPKNDIATVIKPTATGKESIRR